MKDVVSRGRRGAAVGRLRLGLDGDDFRAVCVLMLLYTLQGVPMGLSASVGFAPRDAVHRRPTRTVSLSVVAFSLKVLWAPIVDAMYVRSFGRRRTWVMPLQAVVGVTLLTLSTTFENRWSRVLRKAWPRRFFGCISCSRVKISPSMDGR